MKVPDSTKILIGEVESVDLSEEFAHEKLSPVLAMYKAKSFKDALDKAERLIADGGFGHTSSLYINAITEKEKMAEFYSRMKTCRVLINTPSSQGGIGDLYNFRLTPSLTLGCGSWGGNSVSENVGIKQLAQHQNSRRKEREHALVQNTVKGLYKEGLPARRAR